MESATQDYQVRVDPSDLHRAAIFFELDENELDQLSRRFVEVHVPVDDFIVQGGGEPSGAFYVIKDGTVAVFNDTLGEPVQLLAQLGPGEFFGEFEILGIGHRSVSVRAVKDTYLLKISKDDLLEFLEQQPVIERKLQAAASSRYVRNVIGTLELARSRKTRIRFAHPVKLRLADDSDHPATLHNLSLGGLSLSQAPARWQPDDVVRFGLGLEAGELELAGRISWRREDRIGMAFVETHRNHNMLLQLTIRMLLEATPS